MFYRSTILNNKNSINIKEITINFPDNSSNNESEEKLDTLNVLDNISASYEQFIKPNKNVLNDYDLLKSNEKIFKIIYCEYLLDKLPYNERKVYIEFLLNNGKPSKDISNENMDKHEINAIAYNYFSHNFIYKKGGKRLLFEFKEEPVGYFISNEYIVSKIKTKNVESIIEEISKSLEYYRKDDERFTNLDE